MILTTQRKAMIDELKKLKTHPTADEFYEVIRRKIPKVSIASVYRNLDVLSNTGHVLKIETSGTRMRFDGDLSRHYHLRCSNCGKVIDFLPKGMDLLEKSVRDLKKLNRNLIDFNMEFTGKCGKCE